MGDGRRRIVITVYGVTVEVVAEDRRWLPDVLALLPPSWRRGDPARVTTRFVVGADGSIVRDGDMVLAAAGSAAALGTLDSALRAVIALKARDHVFVHAGVVVRDGRAIVLPGASFSGKTTLVSALVRSGAEYYSDEFAVLDARGAVHPYAKPLSVRSPGSFSQVEMRVEDVGGVAGEGAAEVALIALARYDAQAQWDPQRGTAGDGALALLEHAVAARVRSAAALQAVSRAANGAMFLAGPRGEAEPTARALLAIMDAPAATPETPPAHRAQAGRGA